MARFELTTNSKQWLEPDFQWNRPIALSSFSIFDNAIEAAQINETTKQGKWQISLSDDAVIGKNLSAIFHMICSTKDY
jgi:hypothetical protein